MTEIMQLAIFLLGFLTVIKLLISNFFDIIKLLISELNEVVINIKKLIKNINKK